MTDNAFVLRLQIYLQLFTPLEWTVPGRDENKAYIKLICDLTDDVSS